MDISKIKITDITPTNISHLIEGTVRSKLAAFNHQPPHIKEQAEIRAAKCAPCLTNKSCLHCGCSTPSLFYATSRSDAKKRWGPMLSKQDWEQFKTTPLYQQYINSNLSIDELRKTIQPIHKSDTLPQPTVADNSNQVLRTQRDTGSSSLSMGDQNGSISSQMG